jgi:3-deoxy-D-manno-octulosonate 8-phosphate phosphatase (KDO 8-P phosphatase)
MGEIKPINFIMDADGVLTNGKFLYSTIGKEYKEYGADDSDAIHRLKELVPSLWIQFVTADWRGFSITKKRCDDMKIPCELVKGVANRFEWIKDNLGFENTIYMSDNLFDYQTLRECFYSIAPRNAHIQIRSIVDYTTISIGGEGAVAEACIEIYRKFFAKTGITDHEKFIEFISK